MEMANILGQMVIPTEESTEMVKGMVLGSWLMVMANLTRAGGWKEWSMEKVYTRVFEKIWLVHGVMESWWVKDESIFCLLFEYFNYFNSIKDVLFIFFTEL
jgi:hypothetical protein